MDAHAASGSDWEAAMAANIAEVQATDQAFFDGVSTAVPIITRAGYPRFVGDWMRDARATDVLLARLVDGRDSPTIQAAIVEALPRTSGDWESAITALWDETDSTIVRRMMVLTLEEVEGPNGANALRDAAQWNDATTRSAALRAMTWRDDAERFGDDFVQGLGDEDATVRATAARASGLHRVDAAKSTLARLLETETDAKVRLSAVLAIGQIDSVYARSLGVLTRLSTDSDARVARAARNILAD
jgi:HEAT repeat protein